MSADSENLRGRFSDQLASFDDRLASKADDLQMLAEIQDGIGRLLEASGANEAEIRRTLQERYESGNLRKETFQLVKSMLDRYVTEQIPTSRDQVEKASQAMAEPAHSLDGDDVFAATDVIEKGQVHEEDPDTRVQVGSVLRDRFMLQERVSGGSMGVVYKALDRRLAETGSQEPWVAIKILSPQLSRNGNALRALQQEASKSRCLTHPNIVRFLDFDRDEDLYFIVMEWLDGRTLAEILDSPESRRIDHEQSFRIVRQIGKALDYAHRCGIVHADIKPGNIMMMPNGDVKLFDFGVARVQQQAEEGDFDPGILGAMTPAYSSMQVLTGEDPVPSDDVFSLACLLYRLIAGYRVFGPRNAAEAASEGMSPQPLPGLHAEQWSAVKKALSFSRVTRFGTMAEFLRAVTGDLRQSRKVDPSFTTTLTPDIARHVRFEDSGGSVKWLFALVTLLALLGFAGYQFGIYDEILNKLNLPQAGLETLPPVEDDTLRAVDESAPVDELGPAEQAPLEEVELPETDEILSFEQIAGEVAQSAGEPEPIETVSQEVPEADLPPELREAPPFVPQPAPAEELVDFSTLPPADLQIPITPGRATTGFRSITLREDGDPVVVDFVRTGPANSALTLRMEEVGFSGNRSPWRTGQYQLTNSGLIEFPAGQARARIELSMADDSMREADQQSTLRIRELETATEELASIELVLEDDDQRLFESQLPTNTVAFAVSQVSVLERDPAVQVDLVRFNPDDTALMLDFAVNDVTATAGEDYFPPARTTVYFGPGQRSARILIPLVQDSVYEGDEAFVVELTTDATSENPDVHYRVAVMLRDDDGG